MKPSAAVRPKPLSRPDAAPRARSKALPGRSEELDRPTRLRLEGELEGALKRRAPSEPWLGGALVSLWHSSSSLRRAGRSALSLLLRRRAFDRPLYRALLWAIAGDNRQSSRRLLREVLQDEMAALQGGVWAGARSVDPQLAGALEHYAGHPSAAVAFSAELARVLRGETAGARLAELGLRLNQEVRLQLSDELLVPLSRTAPAPAPELGAALLVLGESERHLGRWLALAELAQRVGSERLLERAAALHTAAPSSSRAGWAWLRWGLAASQHAPSPATPAAKLSAEMLARLSDRPSAERDPSFLFRTPVNSQTRALYTKVAGDKLDSPAKLRALAGLSRAGNVDAWAQLCAFAEGDVGAELQGLATALLHDLGERERAADAAAALVVAKELRSVVWGSRVRMAGARETLVTEASVRWIELGMCGG